MRTRLLLPLFLIASLLSAQSDDYTTGLVEWLGTQYTLTGATFPFGDSEAALFADFNSYNAAGETTGDEASGEQDFARVETITVANPTTNRWDVGWNGTNDALITAGDKMLWVIYLRVTEGSGQVGLIAERNDDFTKEVDVTVEITDEWRRYFIPFEVGTRPTHPVGGMTMGMHLGFQAQTVQIGGMAILNYGPNVPLDQLPSDLASDEYGGFEADAAWRAPAAERIDELRKVTMDFVVKDNTGAPLANAAVRVRMQQHDFEFGTAVKASRFPGGREFNARFVELFNDLDGRGHGFNAAVFENDLKWPAWEQEWISTNEQTRRAIDYLYERDVHIRGHALLWPGWPNLPDRMRNNAQDEPFLLAELEKHLVNFLSTENFDAKIKDWDVINEINTNTDLAAALRGEDGYVTGREVYAQTFARTRQLAPDAELYLNDYITMSLKNTEGSIIYDQYQDFIQELVTADAPIDGIGFQAHLGSSPNSIYQVLETLDDFSNKFDLRAKVTEYDLPRNVPEDLAATYTKDFLTAIFSHPSVDGFMTWNWWDVDTWANPGANLFNEDWSRTAVGDMYVDLIFNEWWTDEDVMTDAQGQASLRGFKGVYEIEVDCNGQTGTATMNLVKDGTVELDCATIVSAGQPELPAGAVVVSPNPTAGSWVLDNTLKQELTASLFDVSGRSLWSGRLAAGQQRLFVPVGAGVYTLRVTDGMRASSLRLIKR